MFCRRVSTSLGVPLGTADDVRLQGTMRDIGRNAQKMEHLSLRELDFVYLEA
jgi:hypothetical protein